jgi:peptidoglycan/LPS O-acetylase OafA/YrhL
VPPSSCSASRPTDVGALAFLDRWSLRQLGVASGSYYVLHMPLLIATAAIAALLIPASLSENAPLLAGWLAIAFSLVAIAPVAILSYRLVEATGIAAGRRLLQARRTVAA